jgi:hypothetical protein
VIVVAVFVILTLERMVPTVAQAARAVMKLTRVAVYTHSEMKSEGHGGIYMV